MQFSQNLDDEPLQDGSVPISGVNNALPPSSIDTTLAADAQNRLSAADGLNRPRPGTIELQKVGDSFDSIHHVGEGVFVGNYAGYWFQYDSRSNSLAGLAGGPLFNQGDNVYSALADTVLYFSVAYGDGTGSPLWKWEEGVLLPVALPDPYLTAMYPLWALYRLIYAYQNTLVISNILDPEGWNVTTQTLTLDPVASDYITGTCLWQGQQIAVFRNGSTWMVQTGPNLPVLDWELDRASATIGCCCNGTIVQCGVDVFFLSETGRGVYALSQMPTSNQMGVWEPISQPIKRYIDRINWGAIKCARATYWNDLYQLSVPMDGATYNNYTLCYSVTLNSWQGIWYHNDAEGNPSSVRDFARDRTDPQGTLLLIGNLDGVISRVTYPVERQYYDLKLDSSMTLIPSSILTRSFTFGETINQIQPHSAKLQFLESAQVVYVRAITDRTLSVLQTVTPTNTYTDGRYYNFPLSLMSVGVCNEIQLELSGVGNWTLYKIRIAAFEAMPMTAI